MNCVVIDLIHMVIGCEFQYVYTYVHIYLSCVAVVYSPRIA